MPNDTECALEMLQARAQLHREAIAQQSSVELLDVPALARPRSVRYAYPPSAQAILMASFVESQISSTSSFTTFQTDTTDVARHFALYKGVPGHLLLTDTEISFTSMKGFRSLSSRLFKGASGTSTPKEHGDKTTILFRDLLANIRSVKKEARFEIGIFDTDGLQVHFANGKVRRLCRTRRPVLMKPIPDCTSSFGIAEKRSFRHHPRKVDWTACWHSDRERQYSIGRMMGTSIMIEEP